jgi:hypothetical protein
LYWRFALTARELRGRAKKGQNTDRAGFANEVLIACGRN